MNMLEFGIACRKYNIEYRRLFGVVPSPADYACSREEFLAALIKSVESETRIENYLKMAAMPDMTQYKY